MVITGAIIIKLRRRLPQRKSIGGTSFILNRGTILRDLKT